jgi:hypothetical protein
MTTSIRPATPRARVRALVKALATVVLADDSKPRRAQALCDPVDGRIPQSEEF